MVDIMLDTKMETLLISSFMAGISGFCKGNLGNLEEYFLKGTSNQMLITIEHNLILIGIFNKNFEILNFHTEAQEILALFNSFYNDRMGEILDLNIIASFEIIVSRRLNEYFLKFTTFV